MINYGFYIEEYPNGEQIETLMTGDGKTTFSDIYFDDGKTAIGMAYGRGTGVIGEKVVAEDGTMAYDIGIRWQIKFENIASIDSMIETLHRVRDRQLKFLEEK